MYCQPAYCNDYKPTKEMNKVRTFSKLCPKDHVLVASSTSNSTSNVALNAIDFTYFLIVKISDLVFLIVIPTTSPTLQNMLSPTSCELLLPTTALRIHLQYCPLT